MRQVLIGLVFGMLAPYAPGAVHAVIPTCCVATGSLTVMNPATGAIAGSLSTGAASAGLSFAMMKGGRKAAVLSTNLGGSGFELTTVDVATGMVTGPLAIPSYAFGVAVNPRSGVVYAVYTTTFDSGPDHIQEIDPATLKVIRDVEVVGSTFGGIAVSPDGTRIYLSASNGMIALQSSDFKPIGTIALAGALYPIIVAPDNTTVYTASGNPGLCIGGCAAVFINAASLQVTRTVPLGIGAISALALSPDASQLYIATGSTVAYPSGAIYTLNVNSLALSAVAMPVLGESMAVAPDGLVYLATGASASFPGIVVFDPTSQTITAGFPTPYVGSIALSTDGKQLYHLNSGNSTISLTQAAPSQTVVRSVPTGPGALTGTFGAYDSKDNLVLIPDEWGNIEMYDAGTLEAMGIVPLSVSAYRVVFGDTAYALSGYSRPSLLFDPRVLRFDPASRKVTGNLAIPYPPNVSGGGFEQPALNGNLLYIPFHFNLAAGQRETAQPFRAGTLPAANGIVVVNTQQMTVAAIWPFNVMAYGFAAAPSATRGYLAAAMNSGAPTENLLEIELSTGKILRTLVLPGTPPTTFVSSPVLSPDGGTIYLSVDGTLYAINTKTLTITNSAFVVSFGQLSITPDGQYIYMAVVNPAYGVSLFFAASLQLAGTIPSAIPPSAVILAGN